MHPVIPETRITLDATLLSQDIIILPLEISADLAEARLIVDAIAKARCIDNGQADARAFLIQLKLDSDRLDADRGLAGALAVEVGRCIGVEMRQNGFLAEGVDEGGATGS